MKRSGPYIGACRTSARTVCSCDRPMEPIIKNKLNKIDTHTHTHDFAEERRFSSSAEDSKKPQIQVRIPCMVRRAIISLPRGNPKSTSYQPLRSMREVVLKNPWQSGELDSAPPMKRCWSQPPKHVKRRAAVKESSTMSRVPRPRRPPLAIV